MNTVVEKVATAFPGVTGWLKRITLFQVIVVGLLAMQGYDYAKSAWGATSWFVKPALAGAIKDVLQEDGIDLKALVDKAEETAKTTTETNKKVETLEKTIQMQSEILGQINKALQDQSVIPTTPQQ